MTTDSEEVEKVLQSLASEAGTAGFNSSAEDGEPDRDKVEELLRQLEQEKEQESDIAPEPQIIQHADVIARNEKDEKDNNNISDSNNNDEGEDFFKPKPKPSGLKKPNGALKTGDKPSAPTRRVS